LNAVEMEEAISALAEQAFDAQEFPFAFLATFRRKIDALGRVVKGAQQRKTRRGRPAGFLQNQMVRAGGFTGQPAFPSRGRC
jgi:hypothetical protein